MPEGRRIVFSGETLQCYDLEGYKHLVLMHTELSLTANKVVQLEAVNRLLEDKITLLEGIQSVQVAQIKLFSDENERLYALWKEENKKRHLAESRPNWGSWIAWGSAGVFATATAVLLVVVAVD